MISNEEKIKKFNLAGYVPKPFDPNQLKDTIARALYTVRLSS